MTMHKKVDHEIEWDQLHNDGRMLKGVLGVVLRHPEGELTAEVLDEIAGVLGRDGLLRLVVWRDIAVQHAATLPEEERRKLAWPGSDIVTDINQYRAETDR